MTLKLVWAQVWSGGQTSNATSTELGKMAWPLRHKCYTRWHSCKTWQDSNDNNRNPSTSINFNTRCRAFVSVHQSTHMQAVLLSLSLSLLPCKHHLFLIFQFLGLHDNKIIPCRKKNTDQGVKAIPRVLHTRPHNAVNALCCVGRPLYHRSSFTKLNSSFLREKKTISLQICCPAFFLFCFSLFQ